MKLKKFFFFTLVFAALVFCISCKGKNDKYADLDDDIINDDTDTDTDTTPGKDDSDDTGDTTDDESDTETDADTDTDVNDNDIPDESHETDHDNIDDSDSDTQDKDDTEPDDSDTEEHGDEDSIPEKDDPLVICTGQKKCFSDSYEANCPVYPTDDFYGQDWQYAKKGYCLLKSFSTTTDTVTDNIFGLIWQRNLPSAYTGCTGSSGSTCTYQQAVDYCKNLNHAGFSDWRLPTPEEFATIIDFGKTAPAVDADIFPIPETTLKTFWTSTASSYSNGKSWTVDFMKGETREENASSNYFYARCVRSGHLSAPEFSQLENFIIKDSQYDLLWTEPTAEDVTWQDALAYCTNLEFAGETGWRLPNINELVTLLNHFTARPASQFPGMSLSYFWSSTSYEGYAYNAWAVNTSDGTIKTMDKTYTAIPLCVK